MRWWMVAALLPLAACGTADKAATAVQSAAQAQVNPTLSTTDANFLNQAAAGGLAEVELGRVAARRGATAQVRRFGQEMVRDHGPLNEEIGRLAAAKGLSPATSLDAPSQQAYDALDRLHGRAFDRTYLQETLARHQDQVTLFQGEIQNGTDPEVKAFAAKYLGVVQHHLEQARQLTRAVTRQYRAQAQLLRT